LKIEIKDNCPLNGFKPCKKFDCGWFIQVRGRHPQTGEEIDEYGCAMAMMPMLMIENSRQTSQAGSAIESFRNEMVKQNMTTMSALVEGMNKQKKLK
jgi:hypothetical protein|tara:strand:- start:7598 stop:7888 length:291 start_codon:yes stop_codon:yes gene_type:complete